MVSRRAQIKELAVQAANSFTSGISLELLTKESLDALRDPYVGVWEPCCAAHEDCPSTAPVKTRGSLLFTEQHNVKAFTLDVETYGTSLHFYWICPAEVMC